MDFSICGKICIGLLSLQHETDYFTKLLLILGNAMLKINLDFIGEYIQVKEAADFGFSICLASLVTWLWRVASCLDAS